LKLTRAPVSFFAASAINLVADVALADDYYVRKTTDDRRTAQSTANSASRLSSLATGHSGAIGLTSTRIP
jgi:hypothetical protein